MKWIKVAIGAVIAIMSIGIIATSVYNMTQERVREEVVSFTINVTEETYTPIKAFDDIVLYSDSNEIGFFNNIKVMKYNNNVTTDYQLSMPDPNTITIASISLDDFDSINKNGNYIIAGGIFSDNDTFEITFEVTTPPQLTGISATLILLTPIIFTGGFLIYLFRKQNY